MTQLLLVFLSLLLCLSLCCFFPPIFAVLWDFGVNGFSLAFFLLAQCAFMTMCSFIRPHRLIGGNQFRILRFFFLWIVPFVWSLSNRSELPHNSMDHYNRMSTAFYKTFFRQPFIRSRSIGLEKEKVKWWQFRWFHRKNALLLSAFLS